MNPSRIWPPVVLTGMLWLALPPVTSASSLPNLLHAEVCPSDIHPAAYWVSEKLDGVRAYWDGERLRFRSGREIAAPVWFTQGLPKQALDGELWLGRGQFERLSGIVRKAQPVDKEWRDVRYWVFEQPGGEGDFSARLSRLERWLAGAGLPHVQVLKQIRLSDPAALGTMLETVVKEGGEGLMLHRADALYRPGRSNDLLKLKPWDDDEGAVLAHLPGQGKHVGQVGALLVQLRDGRKIRIGTGLSDAQRADPPAVGSVITFRYRGKTGQGLPRFASFLRVREAF